MTDRTVVRLGESLRPLGGGPLARELYHQQGQLPPSQRRLVIVDMWEHAFYVQYRKPRREVARMANAWLPWPVALLWTAAYGLLFALHLDHAGATCGRRQVWHGGHALMALGMVVMYLPTPKMLVPPVAGAVVFVLAAATLAVALVSARLRGGDAGLLGVLVLLDLIWMAYMFGAMHDPVAAWSVLGVVWFLIQALGWVTGSLGSSLPGTPDLVRSGTPETVEGRSAVASPATGPEVGTLPDRSYGKRVRVGTAVMSLGMAYMLLAMQFGMTTLVDVHVAHH